MDNVDNLRKCKKTKTRKVWITMLKHIDIYIESDIPPLKRQAGKYGYVLAYINKNNELKTAEGYGSAQSATQNSKIGRASCRERV